MDTPDEQHTMSQKDLRTTAEQAGEDDMGKVKRISYQTKGLVEDVKSWVDLRMTLTQMDIEEKVDSQLNRAIVGAVIGALALLALTFGLVAASLGLGSWLGHNAWGFLIIAGFLLLVTVILLLVKPRVVSVRSDGGSGGE